MNRNNNNTIINLEKTIQELVSEMKVISREVMDIKQFLHDRFPAAPSSSLSDPFGM